MPLLRQKVHGEVFETRTRVNNNGKILVIGASGLVGSELISILLEMGIGPSTIIATSSEHSAGKALEIGGTAFVLKTISEDLYSCTELVFQCASNKAASIWVPKAIEAGCSVVDCSSEFRETQGVPLVIPSLNGDLLKDNPQLVASPNCTTIILLSAIHKLQVAFDVQSITVATYQAISGAGRAGLEALRNEIIGKPISAGGIFPEPCAFNVFCHESPVNSETGFNAEEEKVISEVRKICCDDSIEIMPSCMRVPVERVHTEAITIIFRGEIISEQIKQTLRDTPDVVLLNDEGHFPTALKARGGDEILVGHLRVVSAIDHTTVSFIACGDQLRTGAALNAVRIAQELTSVFAKN
jgi:aspartate-semialdehyde dehydrogenase